MFIDPTLLGLVADIVARAIKLAPKIIELMGDDSDITLEDLMPEPRAALEARIRKREGKDEPI